MPFSLPSALGSNTLVAYDATAFNMSAFSFGFMEFGYYQLLNGIFFDFAPTINATDVSGGL